jgi:hypothetical protein
MNAKIFFCAITFFTVSGSVMAEEAGRAEVAMSVKREILQNWRSEYYEKQHSYLLTSPAYSLEYGEGCVIYRQSFPEINGKVSFARMDFYRMYYATAFGNDCASVIQEKFFTIQEGSDPYSTLDFIRHVYKGPKIGRDKIKEKDVSRLEGCFASDRKQSVDVFRAESQPLSDADGLQYVIVLRCPQLSRLEEIFASGVDGQDEIFWEIRSSVQVDIDDIH